MGIFDKNNQSAAPALSGKEMLIKMAMDKLFENLPPETIANIQQIGQVVAGFKDQLTRIELQNIQILKALHDQRRISEQDITSNSAHAAASNGAA